MNPDTSDFIQAASVNTKATSYQLPLIIYYILFVASTPVHCFILGCLLKWRKRKVLFQSTFYTLLIQHNIADILSLSFYSLYKTLFVLIPHFLYDRQRLRIGAICYNSIYWSFIFRTNGITFMTFHRFFIIVKPTINFTRSIQQAKAWNIWIIYWVPSIIFNLTCFSDTEIGFSSPETMVFAMDPSIIMKAARTSFLYVLISCLISMILYGFILNSIREKSSSLSKSMKREIRLVFQVSLSFIAQIILMIYLMITYILAELEDTVKIVNFRRYFPLAYGISSFVGPFTILIFNKDVSKRMYHLLFQKERNIADILSLILYSICRADFVWTPDIIFYNPQLEIAAIYYNGLYWAIIARCNGIVLMTIHRCLILVKPTHRITWYVQNMKPILIWIVYWIPSFIFCVLFFSYTGIVFDAPDNMALLMDSAKISRATLTSFLYLLISCLICIVAYGIIIKTVRQRSHSLSSSFQREIRLAFQVSFFVAALVVLMIYLFLLNLFATVDDKISIVLTRKYYPIVYGTLSFIGPFSILLFNKDLTKRMRLMIFGNLRSISDILSLLFYSAHRFAFIWIPHLIFTRPEWKIAAVYYNGLYWSIIIRSNGIALMTIHRLLMIVKRTHKMTWNIQHMKPWKIAYSYWVPSLIFSIIFFSDTKIEFDSPETMILVLDSSIINKATKISFFSVLFSCFICILSYGIILKFVRENNDSASNSLKKETRLALQVFPSVIAQIVLLIYLFLLNIFANDENKEQITDIRKYYPLAYGILSFIGPFDVLVFNNDVSKRVKLMVFGENKDRHIMVSSYVPTVQERVEAATLRLFEFTPRNLTF